MIARLFPKAGRFSHALERAATGRRGGIFLLWQMDFGLIKFRLNADGNDGRLFYCPIQSTGRLLKTA
jgi:hypothetical protein